MLNHLPRVFFNAYLCKFVEHEEQDTYVITETQIDSLYMFPGSFLLSLNLFLCILLVEMSVVRFVCTFSQR